MNIFAELCLQFVNGERQSLESKIYLVLSLALWAPALSFFFDKESSWRATPAESRSFNTPCMLFDFYDAHDIWHFLSAGGLFTTFMVMWNFMQNMLTWILSYLWSVWIVKCLNLSLFRHSWHLMMTCLLLGEQKFQFSDFLPESSSTYISRARIYLYSGIYKISLSYMAFSNWIVLQTTQILHFN